METISSFITSHLILTVVIGAALLLILILVILLSAAASKRKRQEQPLLKPRMPEAPAKVFVPIEEPDDEIEAEFLTMKDKIIVARDQLGRRLVEQIRNKGPQALADIITAFDKAQPEIRLQLRELVAEERLQERYAQRLNLPDYNIGVLLEAWKRFPNTDILKDYVELLASPDEKLQMAGVSLLSAMKEPQSLSLLSAALMWPEHYVPSRVAEIFAAIGSSGSRMLAYLLPQTEPEHKCRILETIARIGCEYPLETVENCLTDADPAIRSAAVTALGASHMADAVAPLMIAASDKDWHVRAAVAKALGQIGDERGLSVLDVLSRDEEGWVGEAAKASLDLFAQI